MASNDIEGGGGGFYDLRWQRNRDEEEERKRREREQQEASQNQNAGLTYTPPQTVEPIQENQWDEDEEEEQTVQNEESGSDVNLFDLLKTDGTEEEQTPDTVAEATETVEATVNEPKEQTPKAEEKAEEPIVYLPKETGKGAGAGNGMNAADTKGLLTEDDAWLRENGLSWAADAPKANEEQGARNEGQGARNGDAGNQRYVSGRRDRGTPIEAQQADEPVPFGALLQGSNGASGRGERRPGLLETILTPDADYPDLAYFPRDINLPVNPGGRTGPTKEAEKKVPDRRYFLNGGPNEAEESPAYENPNGASNRYNAANNYRNGDAGNQRYVYRGGQPVQEPEMLFPEDFGGNSAIPPADYSNEEWNRNPDYDAARDRQEKRDAERDAANNYRNGDAGNQRYVYRGGQPEGEGGRNTYENNPQYQTDLALGLVDESFSPETLEEMYGDRQEKRDAERAERDSVDAYSQAYQEVIENGGTDREAEIAGTQAVEAADNSDPIGDMFRNNQENNDAYNEAYGQAYADAISNGMSEREAEAAAMEAGRQAAENKAYRMTDTERMRHDPGYSYVPPALTDAQRRFEEEEAAGRITTVVQPDDREINPDYEAARKRQEEREKADNGRVGAENALPGVMGEGTGSGTQQPNTTPNGGTGTTPQGGTQQPGTTSGTDTTGKGNGGKNVPQGSQYLTPSYGQGGQVVKAPYRKGGYTAEELKAMGNHAYGKKYGSELYEGYYMAPDGAYYPVDQAKANYWRQNGGSYKGWEEGMRDYYNTFGTFYGYRPGWQSAGRVGGGGGGYSYGGGGGGGSAKSSSKSSSGSSSGKNYGSGSSVNNGYYWNGNTSWNI